MAVAASDISLPMKVGSEFGPSGMGWAAKVLGTHASTHAAATTMPIPNQTAFTPLRTVRFCNPTTVLTTTCAEALRNLSPSLRTLLLPVFPAAYPNLQLLCSKLQSLFLKVFRNADT